MARLEHCLLLCALALSGVAAASLEARTGRQLQQVVPEVPPIPNVPLPTAVTNLLSSLGISLGAPPVQQSTSLQSAGATAAAAPAPAAAPAAAQQCTATFAEVLGAEPELFFLSSALQLSGFADRLPSPSLGLTIFAPSNPAFLDLLDSLNMGLLDLLALQDKLPGLLLYSVALGGYDGDTLLQRGSVQTVLSLATSQPYNLNFTLDPVDNHRLVITTVNPDNHAVTLKAIHVCSSWIYVIDQILLPTPTTNLSQVPAVNATFLKALASLGGAGSVAAPASSGTTGVGAITDATCTTSFLAAAQATPGLDFLVQAIQRGNLAPVLPAAGSGATVFAPNNAAFTNMLQTLNLTIMDALNLGDKLQSMLLYHFLPQAYTGPQLVAAHTLDTDLGISTGTPYNLSFAQTAAGQVQVTGNYPGNTANVLNSTNVCNSIVHIVDQVLLPTASLATVPAPGNGLNKSSTAAVSSATSAAALFPGLFLRGAARNATNPCSQAFLDAADSHNLTFLVQAIQAGGLTNALPDLASPSTVFAPVNSAFYHILTGTDFGLDQLAKSGTRLKSVLLYHVLPGGAYSAAQLAGATRANTVLGEDLNAAYPVQLATNATQGLSVSGLYPNDSASVLGSFNVCNSTVYMIDAVLLPATSLNAIPQLNSANTGAAPAPAPVSPAIATGPPLRNRNVIGAASAPLAAVPAAAPAPGPSAQTGPVTAQSLLAPAAAGSNASAAVQVQTLAVRQSAEQQQLAVLPAAAAGPPLTGVAFGAGWYTGCPISFGKGQLRGQATTDAAGAFSLPVPGAAAADYAGGLVTLAAGGGGNACVDALTGLPPPFSLGALVPQAAAGQTTPPTALNALTTVAYMLKRNAASPQLKSVLPLLGGANFSAAQLDSLLGIAFGVGGDAIPNTNYVADLQGGNPGALKLEVLNAELLTSLAIGAQVLVSLQPNGQPLTPDQAVQALYLSTLPVGVGYVTSGKSFSLTSADVLASTFNAAIASFGSSSGGSKSSATAPSAAAAGGRRLMQAAPAPAPAAADPRVQAVGAATAQLNAKLEAVPSAGLDAAAALGQIAQVLKVAQGQVAPAVAQLLGPSPTLSVAQFQQQFSGDALTNLVSSPDSQQLI